jgi:hypothetical protein
MPNTDQMWMQDTATADMEIFVGPSEFKDVAAVATFNQIAGVPVWNVAAAAAANFFADVSAALKKTGLYGNPALSQSQYGTAASLPGPTAVSGTSDPEGIRGFPPFPAGAPAATPPYYDYAGSPSRLATLVGPQTGPVPKGIQVNSVDVIYVLASTLTLGQLGLTSTSFVNNVAPVVASLITLGSNLVNTAQAQPYRVNVPVSNPAFIVTQDSELILNVKLTPAGGVASLYGCVLKCSYNFN